MVFWLRISVPGSTHSGSLEISATEFRGAFVLPMSGRVLPTNPFPVASAHALCGEALSGENGWPDWNVKIPFNCQPRRNLFLVGNGSQIKLLANRCRRSNDE